MSLLAGVVTESSIGMLIFYEVSHSYICTVVEVWWQIICIIGIVAITAISRCKNYIGHGT